jgi:predicted nucleic acid-binding protein
VSRRCYIDVSALAQWYVPETGSEEFEEFVKGLVERLASVPLRTLDALHLAAATEAGAGLVATADRVMADAAAALGLDVASFGPRRT